MARLAFDTPVRLDDVRYEGIEHITADDLEYARELGANHAETRLAVEKLELVRRRRAVAAVPQ